MVAYNLKLGFRIIPEYGSSSGSGRNSRRARHWEKARTRSEYRVLVDNISSRVTWRGLKDYMKQADKVTWAEAHKSSTYEGVVEFACYEDVQNAIKKLDDTELNGRKIKIIDISR